MKPAGRARRERVQAVALVVLLVASALETAAVAGGASGLAPVLLAVTAAAMLSAALWG